MTAEEFVKRLNDLRPDLGKVVNKNYYLDEVRSWSYELTNSKGQSFRFLVEEFNNCLNREIRFGNFSIYNDYLFDETFKEDGFYPFGFYFQDHLFIKLRTGRVEARDLVLTKYYDVAKDEQAFLEAFLIFAKHYAFSLEHPLEQPDFYSLFLSISLEQRRVILLEILKIVGGKKYRPFWVQVFQAWTDEEIKEMGEE